MIMLIISAIVALTVELIPHEDCDPPGVNGTSTAHGVPGWVEPIAILATVLFVINLAATSDWKQARAFAKQSLELQKSNRKTVIRNGTQVDVTDRDLVVGDLVVLDNRQLAFVPADGA